MVPSWWTSSSLRIMSVIALTLVALSAWAFSSPAGSSPDDDFHLASIWCGQGERDGLCEQVTPDSAFVPENVVRAPCFAFNEKATAECQSGLSPSLIEVGHVNVVERSYPGGFYWVHSLFAGKDVHLSVLLMRLVNVLLFVAVATGTFLFIEKRWRTPLVLGVAVTIVPLGMFIIPSTNPSSWVIYAPAFIFLLTRSMLRNSQRRTALATGALILGLAFMASVARSDGALFALFSLGLAALAEGKSWLRRPLFYGVAALVTLTTAWSLLSSRQSTAAAGGLNGDVAEGARTSLGLLFANIVNLPGLLLGGLGTWGLGWLDTQMPSTVWVSTVVALGALVVTAISVKERFREFAIPLVAFAALCALPLLSLQLSGAMVGSYVQPRYVLPLLALAVVALLTTATERITIAPRQETIIFILVGFANVIALLANIRRYSAGLSFGQPAELVVQLMPLFFATVATSLLIVLVSSTRKKTAPLQ